MSISILSHPTKKIEGSFLLPSSKSISNRILVLKAISGGKISGSNLSDADDTRLMQESLKKTSGILNLDNAGTCMRFLTAYFASVDSDILLHGNDRMHARPIRGLVDALRELGAHIEYTGVTWYPPLHIRGKKISGGLVHINASDSSQFVSALMLIAPSLEKGLQIELTGDLNSVPYISMTEMLMKDCGLDVIRNDKTIQIPAQSFHKKEITVESDWSAASYWYALAALSPGCRINLPRLEESVLQGDRAMENYGSDFGVRTQRQNHGVLLTRSDHTATEREFDMRDQPDLVPALLVMAAALNVNARFDHISALRNKESDRITALETELKKLGFQITSTQDSISVHALEDFNEVISTGNKLNPVLSTHGDHRLAMAFAALALVFAQVKLEAPEVVAKSYPGYWEELEKAGFRITTI